jgi:hypothetical protein
MKGPLPETEFAVLRQTISRRGTARMVLVPVTVLGWAALALVLLLFSALPVAALFSLAVLVAGYEAIHALHVGTERIGRYLQVQYEAESAGPRWETTAMAVGPALPGGGIDPLFSIVFGLCTFANLLLVLLPQPTNIELGVLGVVHAGFLVRIGRGRWAASRQRAVELESFKTVLARDRDHPNP